MEALRERLKTMTTKEVAEAFGVSLAMASNIRSGRRALTVKSLAAFIAKTGAYGVDIRATLAEEAKKADELAQKRKGA